jgi:hypothetical protein
VEQASSDGERQFDAIGHSDLRSVTLRRCDMVAELDREARVGPCRTE